MKKRDLIKTTVVMTAMLLVSSVGYSVMNSDTTLTSGSAIAVVDTTEVDALESIELPPYVSEYNKTVVLEAGKHLTLEDLGIKAESSNELQYVFNKTPYKKVGEYTTTVKVRDTVTRLYTTINVKVVVQDTKAPKIYGVKNITVTEGDKINLLEGVTAKDSVSGNLTKKIKVSKYSTKSLDKDQTITYSVKDASGNKTKKTAKLRIKSNPIKKLNKTMYATTSLNVRDSSSVRGKKIGSLAYAQKVIVTGQDKNTGWYRIKYNGGIGFVSNSYLSSKKPVVKKPTVTKPSTSTGSSSSNKGSSSSGSTTTKKPSTSTGSGSSTSKPSSGSTSKPSSGSSSGSSNSNKGSGSSSGSTSKPSTGKPSTSKPSKPSTSKPSNDGTVDCDELPWSSDTWGDDMASNGNHGW